MYAIVESGGAQHRVSEGDVIRVERLAGETGAELTLEKVLLIRKGDETLVGSPYVENATVTAETVENGLADKVLVYKKKRRTKYRRLNGHRQRFTEVKIKKINIG
jgi:large subunit ribosomal protein L21